MKQLSSYSLLALLAATRAAPAADQLRTAAANTSFQLRNRKFGDLLRPRNASNREGAPIVLYPGQPWKRMIWRFTTAGDGAFRLQDHFTSKSLAAVASAADKPVPVQQTRCAADAHDAPAWKFGRLADGAYPIGQSDSDLVWTATQSQDEETRVVLAPWRDADEQKWELLKAPEHPTR